jgi:rhodanese-related sulfurtransferase
MSAGVADRSSLRPGALADLLAADPTVRVLDVRTETEFETVRIPGSHNLPLDLLPACSSALRELDGSIVLVCSSGARARQAEALLRDADLERVQVLEGGLHGWRSAGLPLVQGQARWSLERQVRAIAGGLVLLGTLGSLLVWPPLLGLAIFVGAGLLFAGLTDFCGMARLLGRLPYNQPARCDPKLAIARLQGRPLRR